MAPFYGSSVLSLADDLPSSTVQCHASNLLQLPDGTLLCAWFGGTQEGVSDISIYISQRSTKSLMWSNPVQVSSDETRSEQNPVLFRAPTMGVLWLFHTAQPAGNQDQAVIISRTSTDDGYTWSTPNNAVNTKRGAFVRQPLVVLADGTWVLPIWYCRTPSGYRWTGSDDVSAVMWTRDKGETWHETEVPESVGRVHMNIVPSKDGEGYSAFFRSRWADNIYRSTSRDGIHWTSPVKTTLPNPNSGIAAAALPNGDLVMVFNDSHAEAGMQRRLDLYDDIRSDDDIRPSQPDTHGLEAIWGTPRKALSVGVSKDGGETWKYKILEDGSGQCMSNNSKEKVNKELSYPSIVVDPIVGKGIHVAYTYHRQNIKYVYIEDVEEFVNS